MSSNVSHFRGCFGSWFIRYLALRRISGSARQTTVSSVPVVSASRTVAKPRLYIGFFSCHNSILQLVIGVGPTDQWSITACHVHRRPEAERKMINWDHIALRGNPKGDGLPSRRHPSSRKTWSLSPTSRSTAIPRPVQPAIYNLHLIL